MARLEKANNELKHEVKLKSPAEEVYAMYGRTCYQFRTIMPSRILKVELIKGGWESLGSERRWTFVDGSCGSRVDIVEAINDETKSVSFALLEGEVPTKPSPDGDGCTAKVVLKFDKKDSNADPNVYMDFIREMLELVDEFLQGTRK